MRLARPSAFILALLAAALLWTAVWYMTPEVSTELATVNGPMTRFERVADVAPFRCDSLVAKDCFEMLHRRTANATTTVPSMPLFDRSDLARVGRTETEACRPDVFDRGDRCLKHDNR